jgi:hypothetical protein
VEPGQRLHGSLREKAETQKKGKTMRGAYFQYVKANGLPESRVTQANERALALVKEAAELRLARITNRKEPSCKNGRCGCVVK